MKNLCRIGIIIIAIPSIALSQNLPEIDFGDLTALSETIEPSVSSIRSLNFVQPYIIRYQTNEEITAVINHDFNQSFPQIIRKNYDLLIRAIGWHHGGVPFDFEALKKASLRQIGAYYYLPDRSVNIPMKSIPTEDLQTIIVHELTHVLQDQHFGLASLTQGKNSDQLSAQLALVEGDATLVQNHWFIDNAGYVLSDAEFQQYVNRVANTTVEEVKRRSKDVESDPSVVKTIDETPDFLFLDAIGTYYRGQAFVFALKRRGGWTEVNRAYENPPTSMEHILHPDKYFAGESPEEVALPDLENEPFAGNWEELNRDTLGEFGLRIIFNTFDVDTPSHSAAAGWHGDQYVVLKHRDGAPALVLFTTWDTEQDATEFKTAYEDVLAIKHRGTTDFRIEQQGTDVLIAESPQDLDLLFAYLEKVRFTPQPRSVFDFDGDLVIGVSDFLLFVDHFGTRSSDPDFDSRFDIDGDGIVGISDFLAFIAAFEKQITRNSKPAVVIDPHIIYRTLGFVR